MDKEISKLGAQELYHKTPKNALDTEEKSEKVHSPVSSEPSINHAEISKHPEKRDVEAAQVEISDPPLVKVPRSQRRGLFGRFTIVAEVEEPKLYPRRTKWFITFVVALAAVAAPMGSAIIFRESFKSRVVRNGNVD